MISPRSRTSSARASAGRLADLGADLDHRLVQFGLDLLAEDELALLEDLRDVRLQLPRLRVDDLVLFLDPDRQRRGLHTVSRYARCVVDAPLHLFIVYLDDL